MKNDLFLINTEEKRINKLTKKGLEAKEIAVPEGMSFIAREALKSSKAKRIKIPNTVIGIGTGAFSDNSNLEYIELPPVKVLKNLIFKNCYSLKKIEIPEGVEVIKGHCFENCTNLKTIMLPKSLKEVRTEAFKGCSSIETVIFNGTEEDFQKVKIDYNEELLRTHCIVKVNYKNFLKI